MKTKPIFFTTKHTHISTSGMNSINAEAEGPVVEGLKRSVKGEGKDKVVLLRRDGLVEVILRQFCDHQASRWARVVAAVRAVGD